MPKEKRTEVKTFRVTLHCGCGGEMVPTGNQLLTWPPQYPHVCKRCGQLMNLREKQYPYIEHEDICPPPPGITEAIEAARKANAEERERGSGKYTLKIFNERGDMEVMGIRYIPDHKRADHMNSTVDYFTDEEL